MQMGSEIVPAVVDHPQSGGNKNKQSVNCIGTANP